MYLFGHKKLLNHNTTFILIASVLWLIAYNGIEFVFPSYLESIGKSYATIGILISIIAFGGVLIDLPLGNACSRFSRKKLMILGLVVSIIAVASIFLFTKNIYLAIIFFVLGMGYQTWVVPRDSYFASLSKSSNRSSMYGLNAETQYLGQSIGPILCGFFLLYFGYNKSFIFYIVFALLAIIIVHFSIKKEKHSELSASGLMSSMKFSSYVEGFKLLKKFGIFGVSLLLTSFMIMLFEAVLWALQPLFYGPDILNIPPHLGGLLLACFSIPGIILSYPAGKIADKYGRKKILILSLLLIGISLILFSQITNIYFIFLSAIIISIGWVFALPALDGLIVNTLNVSENVAIIGVWGLFVDMGFVIGPLYAGVMSQLFGIRNTFMSVGIIFLTIAPLLILLKPKRNLIKKIFNYDKRQ